MFLSVAAGDVTINLDNLPPTVISVKAAAPATISTPFNWLASRSPSAAAPVTDNVLKYHNHHQ